MRVIHLSTWRFVAILAISSFAFFLTRPSGAATISFAKVADTNTAIPSGTGNLTGFVDYALDNGTVVFVGSGNSSQSGIYSTASGSLAKVVNNQTAIPNGTGNFTGFNDIALDGHDVAFIGTGSSSQLGLYTNINTSLQKVANTSTQMPGFTVNFTGIYGISLDQGKVSFGGINTVVSLQSTQGIYTNAGGSLIGAAIANTTLVPGSSFHFLEFGDKTSISGGRVVFLGTSVTELGIYSYSGGSITTVVNTHTSIPSGTGTFSSFSNHPTNDAGNVAFSATGSSSQRGIYQSINGVLSKVADKNTAIPLGTGNFLTFGDPSLDDDNVLFSATGSNGQFGIYVSYQGSLTKIIDFNDLLDGKTVSSLGVSQEALSGNQVAFRATFTDSSSGIFLATIAVPEPSTFALTAMGLVSLVIIARRKRRR